MKPTVGCAGHLPRAGLAAQLRHDLVDLPKSRRTDRLTVRQAAPVGVDRKPPVDPRRACRVELLLLAVLAEAALGEVDQLRAALGVLDLRDVDVARVDAGDLERLARGVDARRRSDLERERRAEDLERAGETRAERDSAQRDRPSVEPGGELGRADDQRRCSLSR